MARRGSWVNVVARYKLTDLRGVEYGHRCEDLEPVTPSPILLYAESDAPVVGLHELKKLRRRVARTPIRHNHVFEDRASEHCRLLAVSSVGEQQQCVVGLQGS